MHYFASAIPLSGTAPTAHCARVFASNQIPLDSAHGLFFEESFFALHELERFLDDKRCGRRRELGSHSRSTVPIAALEAARSFVFPDAAIRLTFHDFARLAAAP